MEDLTTRITPDVSADGVRRALAATDEENLARGLYSVASFGGQEAQNRGYVDIIAKALKDSPSPEVKIQFLHAIAQCGSSAAAHVRQVASMCNDSDPEVRCEAAAALGALGPDAAEAQGELRRLLADPLPEIRASACLSLGQVGGDPGNVEELAKLLQDSCPEVCGAACEGLGTHRGGEAKADEVARKLNEPRCRLGAVMALGRFGAAAAKHLEAPFFDCLKDADVQVRMQTANAAGDMSYENGALHGSAQKVKEYIGCPEGAHRCAAAVAVGFMAKRFGGNTASFPTALVEEVKKLLDDKHADSHHTSLYAGGAQARIPPAYRKATCAALVSLGWLGSGGAQHAKDVTAKAHDEDPEVRLCAVDALKCMLEMRGPQWDSDLTHIEQAKVASCLASALSDDDFVVRMTACEALGLLGEKGGEIVELLGDNSVSVRVAAVQALASMGKDAEDYCEQVWDMTKDHSPNVIVAALGGVAKIGGKAQGYAAPVARLAVRTPEYLIRAAAIAALGKMGVRGAAFAEEVAEFCVDPSPDVRKACAHSLGDMGAEAAPFKDRLQTLASDPSAEVQDAAGAALKKIDAVPALES